jgi:hypothetical protein
MRIRAILVVVEKIFHGFLEVMRGLLGEVQNLQPIRIEPDRSKAPTSKPT